MPEISQGELLVALGTGALAVATFWLALESHKARAEAKTEAVRGILRAALAEQLDNCRAWFTRDPSRGDASLGALRRAEPNLKSTVVLLESVDLPADLVAYLVWHLGRIREDWDQFANRLDKIMPHRSQSGAGVDNDSRDTWTLLVDRLQVLAALLAGEARRRGLAEVAAPYDAAPWVTVLERPDRERELRWVTDRAIRGGPAWPADPAFAVAEPSARDRAGAATGARQRDDLAQISDGIRSRLHLGR